MGNLTSVSGYALGVAFLVFGIIICFSGYRLFKMSVTVAGAVIGFTGGKNIMELITKAADLDPNNAGKTIVPIVLAIVCGVLAFSFYRKAFIFVVASMVTKFAFGCFKESEFTKDFTFKQEIVLLLICMVVGLAIGFACFLIQKGAIIFMSAIGGATLIKAALIKYVLMIPFVTDAATKLTSDLFKSSITPVNAVSGLLVLMFGIAGMIVQVKKRS